jgi:hypothetical protein
MLDRIKLRHLLNRGQEMLAISAGLMKSSFGASFAWREALGTSDDLPTRLAAARALFDGPGISLDQPTRIFLSSPEGLSLVVEAKSSIRLRGDRVAHPVTVPRTHFDGPVSRNPVPSEARGLQALVDFVCAQYVSHILLSARVLTVSLGGSYILDALGCYMRNIYLIINLLDTPPLAPICIHCRVRRPTRKGIEVGNWWPVKEREKTKKLRLISNKEKKDSVSVTTRRFH